MSRFVRPVLWTFGALAAGGLVFGVLLSLNIPYRTTAAPETTAVTSSAPPVVAAAPAVVAAWVTDVRPGPDDHTAVLRVDLPSCALEPHARVTEAAERIDADVQFRPPAGPECPRTTADFPVKTAAPIGKRPVIVNAGESWRLLPGGWRKCDKILGCEPPADHCAAAWIAQLEFAAEAEHPGTTRACDQNWLIHDLSRRGQAANRVAYRWAGGGWTSFASAKDGGCGEILAVEPAFPQALCRDLTPPS